MSTKKKDRPEVLPAEAHCIHRSNPYGGFADTHRAMCCFKDGNPATAHLSVGHWCGNVCAPCTKKYQTAQLCGEPLCVENSLPLEASA
jgi:hypothetical protein